MKAFYSDNLINFINTDEDILIGKLTSSYSNANFHQLIATQIDVWSKETTIMKDTFECLAKQIDIDSWGILFEYPIPRRGKRIDVVILAGTIIIVLEFKIGANKYSSSDKMQVEDYCLDLRDFHAESKGNTIVPVLVATNAPFPINKQDDKDDNVKSIYCSNKRTLADIIYNIYSQYHVEPSQLDLAKWERSDYKPTPTIIEAAQTLYSGQNVKEISRCPCRD